MAQTTCAPATPSRASPDLRPRGPPGEEAAVRVPARTPLRVPLGRGIHLSCIPTSRSTSPLPRFSLRRGIRASPASNPSSCAAGLAGGPRPVPSTPWIWRQNTVPCTAWSSTAARSHLHCHRPLASPAPSRVGSPAQSHLRHRRRQPQHHFFLPFSVCGSGWRRRKRACCR